MNEYIVSVDDKRKQVRFTGAGKAVIDGVECSYDYMKLSGTTYVLKVNNKVYDITSLKNGNGGHTVTLRGKNYETIVRTPLQEKALKIMELKASSIHHTEVKAPMPGMILKIKKNRGDEVKQGESILILEAMKMENDIKSPSSGIIKEIKVSENTPVEKGSVLLIIE